MLFWDIISRTLVINGKMPLMSTVNHLWHFANNVMTSLPVL